MPTPYPLHVLLPTHKRTDLLQRCLNSLLACADELEGTTVHIIENGSHVSQDVVAGYADRLPLCYHHFPIGNKSLALNRVVDTLPKTSFLIFFDDDVAIRPATIYTFSEAATDYGPGTFFGGILYPAYETAPPAEVKDYLTPSARTFDLSRGRDRRQIEDFTFFMGACWACFRQDLLAVGSFNRHFGPGAKSGARGQETDAQLRLIESGVQPVFLAGAAVDHWVTTEMVTADYACDRIFFASILRGREHPDLAHTLVMAGKLLYSLVGRSLSPLSVGHRYRIAKAAGYFRGLSQRN